jgi:CBS domain-containing protein
MATSSKQLLSLLAGDIMTRNVIMVPREMSLQGAARLLARAGVSGAPVVDERGACIGVISTTDFMRWAQNEQAPSKEPSAADCMCKAWQISEDALPSCCVGDYMTRDPVLVGIHTRIGDVARMMMDAHIHRVIVVDAMNKRPLGVISSMDLLAEVARADQAEPNSPDHAIHGVHDSTRGRMQTST